MACAMGSLGRGEWIYRRAHVFTACSISNCVPLLSRLSITACLNCHLAARMQGGLRLGSRGAPAGPLSPRVPGQPALCAGGWAAG